jgi:transcriptional regulator with XRE-family HTH domain
MNQLNAIERLKRAGVSRRTIAESCGVTRAAISHWASGRSVPQGANFTALVELASRHGVLLLASDFAKHS